MRKILFISCFLSSLIGFSQINIKNIRESSWQIFVYRISAVDAEQYIKWDSIPVNRFLEIPPAFVIPTDSMDEDLLPIGFYVRLNIAGNEINARVINRTNLIILNINNKQQQQLDIRTREGEFITDANVFVDNKKAVFNRDSKTFWVKQQIKNDALVKVYTKADTMFVNIDKKDDLRYSIAQQRRQNYKYSKIYKILNWLPSKIKSLFTKRKISNNISALGYIIFNQPKYKPLDTVKFKAYIVNKKWRQYKKPVDIYLDYNNKGKYYNQFFLKLQPVTPGAYVGQIILADSLPSDTRYNLTFRTASKKSIIREYFKIEDYVLDEIGSYQFRASKETYFRNDSLYFFANAKDANSLNVMDAKARLILTTTTVTRFYKDTLFVADTIYDKEVKLLTEGDTKFILEPDILPRADMTISAKLIFRNANNELHEESIPFDYKYFSRGIIVKQEADSIKAVYVDNGIEKSKEGVMEINEGVAIKIHFPFSIKIDPAAEDYSFYIYDKDTLSKTFDVEEGYRIFMSRISKGDTLGFTLNNPYKIPVYFTVFEGKKIIATGKESDENIVWKKIMSNNRVLYKLRWQYIWADKERSFEESIGLLYKILDVKITNNKTIFPGQKDSIKIDIRDFKGSPVSHVNLTAVSYNNQFNKDIKVTEPPYLAKYIPRHYIERDGLENDGAFTLQKQYLLGKNKNWIEKFHLDSMIFYKLLFPKEKYYDAVTPISDFMPQVSVNVVEKGVVQEIFLLYINKELAYYNGTTDKMHYVFGIMPQNIQIGIRLKDKYIEIDSLYMQPYYKHDLSFDIDNLPLYSKLIKTENYWSNAEINLLEQSMWQMRKDYYYNSDSYIWQDNKVIRINGPGEHVTGPFRPYQMTYFSPDNFDISFNFEPGYQYNLSKQILRLEKKEIFPKRKLKYFLVSKDKAYLKLGDTLVDPPQIIYRVKTSNPFIQTIKDQYKYNEYASKIPHTGSLKLTSNKDSSIGYIILEDNTNSTNRIVMNSYSNKIKNIPPGNYSLLIVTQKFFTVEIRDVIIRENVLTCVKADSAKYVPGNSLVNKLVAESMMPKEKIEKIEEPKVPEKIYLVPDSDIYTEIGGVIISGRVVDAAGGNGIPYCSITIKGTKIGIQTDVNGDFIFRKMRPGKYILVVMQTNYGSVVEPVTIEIGQPKILRIAMEIKSNTIKEVIVTSAYGIKRTSRSTSFNMQSINSYSLINDALAGKVSGLQIRSQSSAALGRQTLIRLRGENSFSDFGGPIYVVDGIIYKELPKTWDINNFDEITVIDASSAIALFGPDAANGAIIITTKTKTFRQAFRDYALWQPNFFTDENGHASFEVNYPDNVTGWKMYVVAMDKKRRIGKASVLTQAYKPIVAELNVPQFLLEGDSVSIIGKSKNYTDDKYNLATYFSLNGDTISFNQKEILPKDANIDEQMIGVTKTDTIKASFTLKTTTGFKDGEEKMIAVFKKGTDEAIGNFWVLRNDTSVSFTTLPNCTQLNIYAENNTLSILLNELDHLRQYPYYCMEQMASKLIGLAMEKKIREQLNQSFKNQKEFDRLLKKIQKAQLFDGGWAWWENGKANLYITNYITTALLQFRENPLVETNIRSAFLYLQNQLPFLNKNELLASLLTLSEGRHEMDFGIWINKIDFDSLNQHQQWQWIKIKQQQKLNCQAAIKKMLDKRIPTMLGGLHWGEENYSWYSNEVATTVLAFEVLKNESGYKELLPGIIQYFLEKRKSGYWRNTVESASILNTILPYILNQQKDFDQPASITISGDTSFVVNSFPYKMQQSNSKIKNINIQKSGGGLVYFTAYQKIFDTEPIAIEDKFIVRSFFQKNNETVAEIKSGEKIKMIVTVNVLKDAEYVMLQVPIPAGCTYASKTNNDWEVYKEFYKDKLLLFTEFLSKGVHNYEIELEPRYKGIYTINPAKVELMYYPTFFGINEIRKVRIE